MSQARDHLMRLEAQYKRALEQTRAERDALKALAVQLAEALKIEARGLHDDCSDLKCVTFDALTAARAAGLLDSAPREGR